MNLEAIGMFALFYFMIYCSIFWILIYYDKRKTIKDDPKPTKFPLISIIIPVYHGNTIKEIKKSVVSALSVEYPKKEIVLCWNGLENDEVLELCKDYAKKKLVKLMQTPKQGKAAAINHALEKIKGEYFCCLDGDSFFKRDALQNMVGYLDDPTVGAVTSSMKVYKAKTIIQQIQWVEYIFAIYLRRLMSIINALYVVPGPGGMYRTSVVKEIGGFDENILTEDMEISFRIQAAGYKIKNGINAYVDTIVPATFWELALQRVRWYAGFCDTLKKHRSFMFNPKYGTLGMFVLPTSLLWVGILFITLGLTFGYIATWLAPLVKYFMVVGFDLDIFFKTLLKSISFEPTYITIFSLVFLIISMLVIYLGLKLSTEKADLPRKFPNYFGYMAVYTIMFGLFWMFTVAYLVIRKRKNYELIKW